MSEANIGTYRPCSGASHVVGMVGPDTLSLRSLVRDDIGLVLRAVIRILFAIIPLAAPRASAQMPAPGDQRTSRSGVYTAEQAERGRMTYAISCRSCHTAASHTGVTFAKWWKDRTVADLYGYMSTQMPKNDPGSLNPEQYAEVVAYLLKMNAMPTGTTELLADSSALAQIRIELPPPKPAASTPTRKPQAKSPTRTKGP